MKDSKPAPGIPGLNLPASFGQERNVLPELATRTPETQPVDQAPAPKKRGRKPNPDGHIPTPRLKPRAAAERAFTVKFDLDITAYKALKKAAEAEEERLGHRISITELARREVFRLINKHHKGEQE